MSGRTLEQFEQKHGGEKIATLKKQLENATHSQRSLTIDMPDDNNTIQFGVTGDLHRGSLFEAGAEYRAYRKRLQAEGINLELNAGDVLSGHRVYRGHEYEVYALGFAEQKRAFLKSVPDDGIKTVFITGNHDASLKNLAGVNVGEEIQAARPSWEYIGEYTADVTLRTKSGREYRVRLLHPDGGTAYALSYRLQKQIESLSGGSKPNMLISGHNHKALHLPSYRNVDGLESGCFEWQTPFMARKGSAAHVGGWIVRVTVGDNKSMSNSVKAEFVAFYKDKL
jgi:hypothetical protein